MLTKMTNLIKYSSTALAPTQILYGFKTREAPGLLRLEEPEAKAMAENDVNIITAYPITRARARQDRQEDAPVDVPPADQPVEAPLPPLANKSKKMGPQTIRPFPVLGRIGRLAYRLQLPPMMRIHNVISVAHLEPATDPAEDPYRRRRCIGRGWST